MLSADLADGRKIEYEYDPLGRRIAKKINGAIVEKYLWAGLTQLLAVYDAADKLVMRFEYSDSRMPTVMTKGSETYYFAFDQVGSLRGVFNSSGSLVKRIDYDAFGNILSDSNAAFAVPFGFAGGMQDRDTGLVHFGLRDYDPATGRWTAKDPIGLAGGDTDLYGYTENDPINLVDPTGKISVPLWGWIDFGEGFGQDALNYWAGRAASASNIFEGGLYNTFGFFAALWTPCTSDATLMVLSIAEGINVYGKSPAWYQYYPKGSSGYESPWLARGTKFSAPYRTGQEAREALNLPPWNPGTAVRRVNIPSNEAVAGPRIPKPKPEWGFPDPGKGKEYYRGPSFPD